MLIGIGVAYRYSATIPSTYRASAKLIIETDRPVVLASNDGFSVSPIPGPRVIAAQLRGDEILSVAAQDATLQGVSNIPSDAQREQINKLRAHVRFESETDARDSRSQAVFKVHYDSENPDLCIAAVNAVSKAFSTFYEEQRENSLTEVARLVTSAKDRLLPDLQRLEEDYHNFRAKAPLLWSASGDTVNPHREMLFQLQEQRLKLDEERRALVASYNTIKKTWEETRDPTLVLALINQLSVSTEQIAPPTSGELAKEADETLAAISVEKSLIPLIVEQELLLEQFGPDHPLLASMEKQIDAQRTKLNELQRQETERIKQIQADSADDTTRATSVTSGYIKGIKERITILDDRIEELEKRSDSEKAAAAALVQFENDDTMYRRQIDRHQGLLNQLEEQLARLNLVDDGVGISVRELESAVNASRIGPDQRQHLIMGGLGGLMLGLGLAFLWELSSKTFRTPDEISQALDLPILTHLPYSLKPRLAKLPKDDPIRKLDPHLVVAHDPGGRLAESIRSLRTAMMFASKEDGAQVFMFTSPLPGDGKSTIAANVAASIAAVGKRVLLLDCDLRRPQLHKRFNLSQDIGLSSVLNGEATPDEAAQPTPIENLSVVTSGPLSLNPAEALAIPEFGEAIDWYRERYDYLIIDSPPVLAVSDATTLVPHSDRVLLALRIQRKIRPLSIRAVETLRWHNANIMGLVINAFDDAALAGSYQPQVYAGGKYSGSYAPRYGQRTAKAAESGAVVVTGKAKHPSTEGLMEYTGDANYTG